MDVKFYFTGDNIMKRWICSFLMLFSLSLHAGEIFSTADFALIKEEANKLDSNSLILFDVDATLIVPDDAILRPKGKALFKKLISNHSDTDKDLFRDIRMSAPHSIVDHKSIKLVRKLQRKKIPVLAFTAAAANLKNAKPGEWRVRELKGYGFDFSRSFQNLTTLFFPKNPEQPYCPMYNSGVLYSSLHPKGDILVLFLQSIDLKPKKVIFIDDELDQVRCVVDAMDKQGIPCIGIHYTAVNDMFAELDSELANFQVNFFAKNNIWVCDYEANNYSNVWRNRDIAMLPK